MIHIVVLVTAGAISSYSALDRSFFPTFHAGVVPAVAADQGVAVGDLSLDGGRKLLKKLYMPLKTLLNGDPTCGIVVVGDNPKQLRRLRKLSCREVLSWNAYDRMA